MNCRNFSQVANFRPILSHWDRCYDFFNIFAEKFSEKMAFLTRNKGKFWKTPIFPPNIGKNRRKLWSQHRPLVLDARRHFFFRPTRRDTSLTSPARLTYLETENNGWWEKEGAAFSRKPQRDKTDSLCFLGYRASQGCQMVYFQTKYPKLGQFWRA
jgi:hypothetical protein